MEAPVTISRRSFSERFGVVPHAALINRIPQTDDVALTVFSHKRVEYNGTLHGSTDIPILARILIVQPRDAAGEPEYARVPTAIELFGSWFPTLGQPLLDTWIGLSDRAYVVEGRLDINNTHRLTNNLSLLSPTVGGLGFITRNPMYIVWYSDIDNEEQHLTMNPIFTRVIGTTQNV